MSSLSNRVNLISESQTIEMARKSRELIAKGIDIISLSLGEPDFETPQKIKNAAVDAINNNYTKYTHVSGYIELREAAALKFKRDNGLDYKAENIVISTGAKQSIANAMFSLVNPGDEVLIPAPYWVSYLEILKLTEGTPIIINSNISTNYKVSAADLEQHITSKTKLLIFSTPCNPTGSVYSKDELFTIAQILQKYPNIFIISDEIYEHINFVGQHHSIAQFDFIKDRVIVINGVSKGFAMTGWRGGIMAASTLIAKACDKLQGQFTSATSSITQKAMHAAMLMPASETHYMRDAFLKRRDLVLNKLKEIPQLITNIPDGAFYVYPDISKLIGKKHKHFTINNGTDLSYYLLEEAHVALVPGAAFGDDNYIRISYATSEEKLNEAFNRIKIAVNNLK